jgi:transposase
LESRWKKLELPAHLLDLLAPLRRLILDIDEELQKRTQAIAQAAPSNLPVGLGQLTYETIEREVCDWDRFGNRRQVGSYTGMCPSEDSSDDRRFQGSINKHGNRRLRSVLLEASWRLIQFQPNYKPVAKWMPVLVHPKTTKSKRKQIAIAIGRQFAVDWWRVRTQRCPAQDLGLRLKGMAPRGLPLQAEPVGRLRPSSPEAGVQNRLMGKEK